MREFDSGSRIKYYRSLLGISQSALIKRGLSVSMINFLETGKKKLTAPTAAVLANTLNTIARQKSIELFVELNDLMMPDEDYAKKACIDMLNEMETKEFDLEKYNEILDIIDTYKIYDISAMVYKKIHQHYYLEREYKTAISYLEKGLEFIKDTDLKMDRAALLNSIGTCLFVQGNFNNALEYYQKSYDTYLSQQTLNKDFYFNILHNLIICHAVLDNLGRAFLYLDDLLLIKDLTEDQTYRSLILKANLMLDTERYEEALNTYKKIANGNSKLLYIVLNNMAKTYFKLNKIQESIEYFTASILNQADCPVESTTFTLMPLAGIYKNENRFNESITFYNYAFNNAIKYKQVAEILSISEKLFELYRLTNTLYKFEYNYEYLKKLCDEGLLDITQIEKFA